MANAVQWTGVPGFIALIKQEVRRLELEAINKIKEGVIVYVSKAMSRTPVWSGETVRNYGVGVGGRRPSYRAPSGTDPGPTSMQALGEENLRPENEQAAWSDIMSTLSGYTQLRTVTIVNTVPDAKWDLIDSGSAPTKEQARNPGGVSKLALQSLRETVRELK